MKVPIGVSNRHIHLSQKDADVLFGEGYEFKELKALSQKGQFAYQEMVTLKGPKGSIGGVRVLGPVRSETQVEILATDNYTLGINAPLRISGDIENTVGIEIISPTSSTTITKGVIVAERHIHMSPSQAQELGLQDKEIVNVKIDGPRGLIFNNVHIRTNERFDIEFHIDREEGDAAGIGASAIGEIIKN